MTFQWYSMTFHDIPMIFHDIPWFSNDRWTICTNCYTNIRKKSCRVGTKRSHMDLKHNRTDLKPTICHLMSPMSTMNREFTLYQISDINILQSHVGFKHSPMDKKSPRSSACRSEEKNFFFFFQFLYSRRAPSVHELQVFRNYKVPQVPKVLTDIFMVVKVIIFQLNEWGWTNFAMYWMDSTWKVNQRRFDSLSTKMW